MLTADQRQAVEDTIEALIALLDAQDGDADLEATCEGEGDYDEREPEDYACVPTYSGDLDGSLDQTRIVSYLNIIR